MIPLIKTKSVGGSAMRRIIVIKLSVAAIVAFPIAGCGSVCSSDSIGVYRTAGSPYIAQLKGKNCGATTRYVYELFLSRTGEKDADLVLRFDDNGNQDWPEDERNLVRLQLTKPNTLKVNVTEPVRVFKHEKEVIGLEVKYDFRPNTKVM
jgi:hypothetical protein